MYEDDIKFIELVMMVVDGKVVYGIGLFFVYGLGEILVLFEWLLVVKVLGYYCVVVSSDVVC